MVTVMSTRDILVIGACVVVLAIALIADNGFFNVERDTTTPMQAAVTAEPTSKPVEDKALLVTACELEIKPQLKNPKSFDVDMHQTQVYSHEGNIVLDMFYYAENSYGATSINEVFCDFTQQGTLMKVTHA